MFHLLSRRTAARLIFIIGLFLMILGSAFLLATLANISRVSILVSFLFVMLGCVLAVFAIKLNKRSLYLFFAGFFLQLGFFLFLSALKIVPVPFSKGWPLISVFSGLALFPAGWRRYGALRSSYVVPSVVFVVLGSVLMIFSLDMVPFSFSQFIMRWWPFLIVLAGLIMVFVSLGSEKDSGNSKR